MNENRALGVAMEFSKVVAKISWKAREAVLETTGRETYLAAEVIHHTDWRSSGKRTKDHTGHSGVFRCQQKKIGFGDSY